MRPTAASRWSGPRRREARRSTTYPVRLTVICDDRPGLLKEMTAVIAADDTNIRNLDSRESGDGGAIVDFVVLAQNLTHLNKLVMDLRRVAGVREVQRSQKDIVLRARRDALRAEALAVERGLYLFADNFSIRPNAIRGDLCLNQLHDGAHLARAGLGAAVVRGGLGDCAGDERFDLVFAGGLRQVGLDELDL